MTGLSALIEPLGQLAARVPHGGRDASDQSRGPLTVGAGGGTQAQRGGAHRYWLPSTPWAYALLWTWGGGAAPGDSGRPSCPLPGRDTLGGARDVAAPPARAQADRPA